MESNSSSIERSPQPKEECPLSEWFLHTPTQLLSAKKSLSFRSNSTARKRTTSRQKLEEDQHKRKEMEEEIRRKINESREIVRKIEMQKRNHYKETPLQEEIKEDSIIVEQKDEQGESGEKVDFQELKRSLEDLLLLIGEGYVEHAKEKLDMLESEIKKLLLANPSQKAELEEFLRVMVRANENVRLLQMEHRELTAILSQMNETDGFNLAYEDRRLGFKMFTKQEEGVKGIIMKCDVVNLKIPLFNLLALIYEIDLYTRWFPFCKQSKEVVQVSKARKMANVEFMIPAPFSNRGAFLYGTGINRLERNGSIMVVAKSVELLPEKDRLAVFKEQDLRLLKASLVNMLVYYYACEIIPIDGDTIHMRAVFKVDPQITRVPQGLINWTTKQFGNFLVHKMLKYARNIEGSEYEKRINGGTSSEIYQWLRMKLSEYYTLKQWDHDLHKL